MEAGRRAGALIVTGTDTGVGKTIVAASLARALRDRTGDVGVIKPFASGVELQSGLPENDVAVLRTAAGTADSLEEICPFVFKYPLAPASSAQIENRTVDIDAAEAHVRALVARHEVTIIEGVGGAAVPVFGNYLFSDFLAALKIPALIVARSGLGTINHTILTAEHLRAKQVPLFGVLFVRHVGGDLSLAEQTGPPTAAELAGLKDFGIVPYVADLRTARSIDEIVARLPHDCEAIGEVVESLFGGKNSAAPQAFVPG